MATTVRYEGPPAFASMLEEEGVQVTYTPPMERKGFGSAPGRGRAHRVPRPRPAVAEFQRKRQDAQAKIEDDDTGYL